LEYFQKQLPHFEGKSYEIAKIFEGFWADFWLSSFEIRIFPKNNCHILRKIIMKLARFSKDFGLIYRFCLLKSPHLALEVDQHLIGFLDFSFFYLSCRHIWLNIIVADCHFWCNMRNLKNKNKNNWRSQISFERKKH
jgi:hypothetical protein